MTSRKTKGADVHIVDNASEWPRGVAYIYATLATRPYQQQNQSGQAPCLEIYTSIDIINKF